MKNFIFERHHIILLVGPSNCGKSFLASNIINPSEQGIRNKYNYEYLSSDGIRQDLLNDPYFDKYSSNAYFVSKQAFELLFNKLDYLTQFPVNAPYIIVDTTGLQKEFRDKVLAIANKNNYNVSVVMFDYKRRDDYFKFHKEENYHGKQVTKKHVDHFKNHTVKEIGKKEYKNVYKITSPDEINNVVFELPEEFNYKSNHYLGYDHVSILDKKVNQEYYIIGDVHNSFYDLKQFIIEKCNLEIDEHNLISNKNTEIYPLLVLVGDYIDKGKQLRETIEFIYKNIAWFKLVKGNHENFVYKYLKGEIKGNNNDLIDQYFDSIRVFEQDEELKNKFFTLVEMSQDFYYSDNFFVCHAPAELKYLGKTDKKSIKNQQTLRLEKKRNEFETEDEYNKFIKDKLQHCTLTQGNGKPILFGHIAFDKSVKIGSYYGIDTGAVYGNYLTGAYFQKHYLRPTLLSIKSSNEKIENEVISSSFMQEQREEFIDLSDYEKRRLEFIVKNKINYISGTMSPCDKIENDIESLENGLQYYKDNGIEEIVLEPKYMGSRLQIYLDCIDPNNSYAVTRNGFKIRQELNDKLIPIYHDLFYKFVPNGNSENPIYKQVILDGEILPWSFLGEGLISERFVPIQKAVERELAFLKENDFEQKFQNLLLGDYTTSNFKVEHQNKQKELVEQLGNSKFETYKNFTYYLQSHIPTEEQEQYYNKYKEQIEIHCSISDPEYKAFSILKIILNNGQEKTYKDIPLLNDNFEMFKMLNKEENCIAINFQDSEYLIKAQQYFNSIVVERKMEGIVLKPKNIQIEKSIVPYLKCRNKDYLTLVYGYDYLFPKKYERMISKKGIKNKLRISMSEYVLGMKMLDTNINELDNKDYRKLVIKMIAEQSKEKQLDPRL